MFPTKVALSSLKILPDSENLMGIGGERESLEEINICEERRYPAEEAKVEERSGGVTIDSRTVH